MSTLPQRHLHDAPSHPSGLVALLTAHISAHWGIIRVSGNDAETFLHNQLSNDIAALDTHSCLAAWCDAKGRMLASMMVLREPNRTNAFLLLCRSDLLPLLLQRLKMFVLRSKVILENASAEYDVHGFLGTAAQQAWQLVADSKPMQDWHCIHRMQHDTVSTYIVLPSGRILWLHTRAKQDDMDCNDFSKLDINAWIWAEIASGIVMIEKTSSGNHIPQMLNYESVGAINFKKGCYPGQEIVARTQFRSTIKRRCYIMTIPACADVHIGDSVWSIPTDTPNNAFECGTVIQVASYKDNMAIFALLQIRVIEQYQNKKMKFYIDANAKRALQLYAWPYSIVKCVT